MKIRAAILLASLSLAACAEQPKAGDKYVAPAFVHDEQALTQACSQCHEEDRPGAFLDTPHGGGKDCATCHVPKDDNSGWLPRRAFTHQPPPTGCLDCHIKERPVPPHVASGDCVSCHKYPSFNPPTTGG